MRFAGFRYIKLKSFMKKITFVVPCYNVSRYIVRCIDSILSQGLKEDEFEIIAVNDGSTDDTLEKLELYKDRHSNFSIITQNNKGLSCARNAGMENASGEFIWFVDSDDYLKPNYAPSLYNQAKADALDILFFAIDKFADGKSKIVSHKEIINDSVDTGASFIISGYQPNSACVALYRNEFLREHSDLRFYPKLYHQDVEFNYRAVAFAERVKFVETAPYVYEIHEDSISQSILPEKKVKRLIDNGIIAHSFELFSKDLSDKVLAQAIMHQSRAIIIGSLVQLKACDRLTCQTVISSFRKRELFPVKGPFKSAKQYLGAQLLNLYYCRIK